MPGESYLAVLDALDDSPIRKIVCRQEGGAAMMADCHGRLTGRPGICFVTRGPGATNASAGIHIAMQDSTPVIMFIGQVARGIREREAFQEVDYRRLLRRVAKWVVEIDDAARIPELVPRAFAVAASGRPGPVIVALPEDMLTDVVERRRALPFVPVESAAGKREIAATIALLEKAERPIVILGGTRWTEDAVKAMPGRCLSAGSCRSALLAARRCATRWILPTRRPRRRDPPRARRLRQGGRPHPAGR